MPLLLPLFLPVFFRCVHPTQHEVCIAIKNKENHECGTVFSAVYANAVMPCSVFPENPINSKDFRCEHNWKCTRRICDIISANELKELSLSQSLPMLPWRVGKTASFCVWVWVGSDGWGLRLSGEIRSKDATHMLWRMSRLLIKEETGGLFFLLPCKTCSYHWYCIFLHWQVF